MPSAPRPCFTTVSLYLDYNGVLNAGRPDFLSEMCIFLVAIDKIHPNVRVALLSKRNTPKGRRCTMDELNRAGVLDLFDQITFTSERTGRDHHGDIQLRHDKYLASSHQYYCATSHQHDSVQYQVFQGGKDQYICRHHDYKSAHSIVFVDDKAENLWAVKAASPLVRCIEMRRHHFLTNSNMYDHVYNLDELLNTIRDISKHHHVETPIGFVLEPAVTSTSSVRDDSTMATVETTSTTLARQESALKKQPSVVKKQVHWDDAGHVFCSTVQQKD